MLLAFWAVDAVFLALGFGLIWAAVNITRVLAFLVRHKRPIGFAALQQAAIWIVGGAATIIGIFMVVSSLINITQ